MGFLGWLSVVGWQAFVASGAFLCATITQGLVVLNYPNSYIPERWHGTLIFYLVLLFCVFVNTILARALPRIEGLILIIHVFGFFGILIPLTYLAEPVNSASFVFTNYTNFSGWEDRGLSWFIGLLSAVFPFLGYDGPCHMGKKPLTHSSLPVSKQRTANDITTVEEVENATTVVPWCMVVTILLNGSLAFGIVIAFLFCMGDMAEVLQSPTGFDFIQVFYNVTGSLGGSSTMVAVLIALACFATFGLLASTSRLTWAFARDNGLPFSNFFGKVHFEFYFGFTPCSSRSLPLH